MSSWEEEMDRTRNFGHLRGTVATALLFSVCALIPQRAAAQDARQDLGGTTWRLVKLTMSGQTVVPDDRMKYTLSFAKKGAVAIHADCNRGRARYTDPAGTMEIDKVTLTKAKCAPGSIADKFARAIGFTESYTIRDGNLMLGISSTGDTLQFEPASTKAK